MKTFRLSKLFPSLLLGSVLLTAAEGAASDRVDLAEFLDEDSTFLFLVRDMPELESGFSESAFGELMENEDLRQFLSSMVDRDVDAEMDESADGGKPEGLFGDVAKEQWEQYGHLFDGALAFGLTAPSFDGENFAEWSPDRDGHFFILGEFAGTEEDFSEFLDPWSDERPENLLPGQEPYLYDEDFMGYTLHVEEVLNEEGDLVRRNGWALVDGILVLAEPMESLRDVVARIADPSEGGGIGQSDRFLDVKDRAGDGDVLLYLDLEELARIMGKGMEIGMNRSLAEGGNPLGIEPAKVVEAIGLGALDSLHLSVNFGAEESVVRGGLSYSEKKGVLNLLSYGEGPIPYSSLPPEDAVSSSVGRVRWNEVWSGIKEMLGEISPNLTIMLEMTRKNFERTTGVDFERSLIGALGEETVTYATLRETSDPEGDDLMLLDSVIAIQLRDPNGFNLAIEGVKGMFGLDAFFEETNFGGATIFTSAQAMPGDPESYVSYALTGDYFLFATGKGGLLQDAVSRMNGRDSGFWNRPDVQEVVAELPPEAVGASYSDLGLLLGNMIDVAIAVRSQDPEAEEIPEGVRNLSKGDLFPHFVITGQVPDEDGFFFESLILPMERLEQ